jgi:hypothetical protein
VSHAKADGDETAWSIINHVNSKDQDVPLDTFYDAKELMPGEDYQQRFIDEIENGTLLAIVSDMYDSRPWCVFELTEAKRKRRPIVLADVSRLRTTRTYPYGANLPRVRYSASGRAAIESLLWTCSRKDCVATCSCAKRRRDSRSGSNEASHCHDHRSCSI